MLYARFQKGLTALGVDVTERQCMQIIERFGSHRGKCVRYREFLVNLVGNETEHRKTKALLNRVRRKVMKAALSVGSLRQPFLYFDANGNGVISRKEFASGLLGLGLDLSRSDCHRLLDKIDLNNDGRIDFSPSRFSQSTVVSD